MGQAHVRSKAQNGTLPAIAVSALYSNSLPGCDQNSVTASLNFDGVSYNRLPRVLQVDSLRSTADVGPSVLVLNRIAGDLLASTTALGSMTGTLFDDSGSGFTFNANGGATQLVKQIKGGFPMTTPSLATVVPTGHTGWLKIRTTADAPILGAVFEKAPPRGSNLPALTLAPAGTLVMPVEPPSC